MARKIKKENCFKKQRNFRFQEGLLLLLVLESSHKEIMEKQHTLLYTDCNNVKDAIEICESLFLHLFFE